jgi:hypothetical protein
MASFKRVFRAFLGNPGWLFAAWCLVLLAGFAISFWVRGPGKAGISPVSGEGVKLLAANIHWMISLVPPAALGMSLIMGYAFKPLASKVEARTSLRFVLLLCLFGGGLHFLHGNWILPKGNEAAMRLRQDGRGTDSMTAVPRTSREMSIREMGISIRVNREDIGRIKTLGKDMPSGPALIAKKERWIARLEWERAKRIQFSLWLPLLAIPYAFLGFALRSLRNGAIRFILAFLFAKYPFKFLFQGLIALESRQLIPGASAWQAWSLTGALVFASLTLGLLGWVLFLRGRPEDPVLGTRPEF